MLDAGEPVSVSLTDTRIVADTQIVGPRIPSKPVQSLWISPVKDAENPPRSSLTGATAPAANGREHLRYDA